MAVGELRNPVLIVLARWNERMAYRHAARVIALSSGIAEGVIRAGYPRERLAIVPNGCDQARFQNVRGGSVMCFRGYGSPIRTAWSSTAGRVAALTASRI